MIKKLFLLLTIIVLISLSGNPSYSQSGQIRITHEGEHPLRHRAQRIDLDDAGGYYTATEIETALQEIGDGTFKFSDLLPQADDTYDIGSSSYNWQDLYLSGDIYADSPLKLYVNNQLAHTWSIGGENVIYSGEQVTYSGENVVYQ